MSCDQRIVHEETFGNRFQARRMRRTTDADVFATQCREPFITLLATEVSGDELTVLAPITRSDVMHPMDMKGFPKKSP